MKILIETAEARTTLSDIERLRMVTRKVQPKRWVPLVAFGLIIVGAVPLYLGVTAGSLSGLENDNHWVFGGFVPSPYAGLIPFYWLLALPTAYIALLWLHRRSAAASGVSVSMFGPAIAGFAGVVALAVTVGPFAVPAIADNWWRNPLLNHLAGNGMLPLFVIGAGLAVWAIRGRSLTLLAITLVYLVVTVIAAVPEASWFTVSRLGIDPDGPLRLGLCLAVPALVLLIGAGVLALQDERKTGSSQ